MKRQAIATFVPLILTIALSACGKSDTTTGTTTDVEENAQQVGDAVASIDEAGGSGGSLGLRSPVDPQLEAAKKFFARRAPEELKPSWYEDLFAPKSAQAASCLLSGATFGSCLSHKVIRTYAGCTVGSASIYGTVDLTWSGSGVTACAMGSTGDSVTREPALTVTGRRSATLTISKSGTIGQKVTWVSGTGTSKVFDFTNDGIRRVFALGSTTLFDFTTTTTAALTVTGPLRSSRVLSSTGGAALRVTNNKDGSTCDYVPTAVTWSSTCNCPVSGSWTATCSNGKTSKLEHTSCGSATFTLGSDTTSVSFDRCYGL